MVDMAEGGFLVVRLASLEFAPSLGTLGLQREAPQTSGWSAG